MSLTETLEIKHPYQLADEEYSFNREPSTFTIEVRRKVTVNTDPQGRCYNGCHFSSELRWSDWDFIEVGVCSDRVDRRLEFYRELNDYAVSERGEGARCEYRKVLESEVL